MNKGFTLIELLVVVLIIGILSAIAVPQFAKVIRKARLAEAFTYIKNVGDSIKRYYELNGTYEGANWKTLDIDYTKDCNLAASTYSVNDGILLCNHKNGVYTKEYFIDSDLRAVVYDETPASMTGADTDLLLGYDYVNNVRWCVSNGGQALDICKSFGGAQLGNIAQCSGLRHRAACYSVP